jgi:hypothetical protein
MARFSKGEWAVGEAEVEWRWVVEEEEEGLRLMGGNGRGEAGRETDRERSSSAQRLQAKARRSKSKEKGRLAGRGINRRTIRRAFVSAGLRNTRWEERAKTFSSLFRQKPSLAQSRSRHLVRIVVMYVCMHRFGLQPVRININVSVLHGLMFSCISMLI